MSQPMRGVATFVAVLTLLVASFALAPPAPVGAQEDVCPVPDRPVDPDDPAIVVDTPEAGGTITSPATVQGQARVFEANVRIQIFDADGNTLADTFTTAEEAAPAMAPFATSVEFELPEAEQAGCVWVFEESAEDGEPVHVVSIPVTIEPVVEPEPADPEPEPDEPAAPAPAPTGSGGLAAGDAPAYVPLTALALTLAALLAARNWVRRPR